MRWKGLGREQCKTRWIADGHELTIAELANRLKEIIRLQYNTQVDCSGEAIRVGFAAQEHCISWNNNQAGGGVRQEGKGRQRRH